LNLDRAFFARHPATVARELVGHRIVHEQLEPVTLRIVETEAYLGPEDPGSHATRGPDTQAGTLWETPGQAYVYVCYGIHQMLNVVAHEPDEVGAVLLRAGASTTPRTSPADPASSPRHWPSRAKLTTAWTSPAVTCGSSPHPRRRTPRSR